jgi:hypothetical protein
MVTVAVGGGLALPLSAIWIKHRQKLAELEAEGAAGRVSELEERTRVLESIVTDRGYDIATQIEALRDQRRVERGLDSREVERTN